MATKKRSSAKRRAPAVHSFEFSTGTPESVIAEIRKGYGWGKVARFQKTYDLKDQRLAHMIGLSNRTLTRHRREEDPLDPISSDRFYRAEKIIGLATIVFETADRAMQWLRRPQHGLGNLIPLEILDTEPGARAVQALLTQIEYSVLP